MFAQFIRKLIPTRLRPVFLLRTYFVFFKRLDSDSAFSLPNGFTASVVSAVEEYKELIATGYDFSIYPKHENIEVGLNGGACLICIFQEKTLAHSTWVAFDHSQAKYDSLFLKSRVGQPSDAFIGPCNTYIPFRGQGLYPAALAIACNHIRKHGMSRALINTKKSNQASIRGIVKSNFGIINRVRLVYLLGRKITFLSSMSEYVSQ